MRLDEAIEAVLGAAVDAVRDAVADADAPLGDVREVVLGDRARPMPKLPSVWLVPGIATQHRAEYGEEEWTLPLSVAAMVKGDDPEVAAALARQIAALARSAILDVRRTLGDSIDAVSVSYDPAARRHPDNRTLFWVEAVVAVTFAVTE